MIQRAASLARNAAACATSQAVPSTWSSVPIRRASRSSGVIPREATIGVYTVPGQMPLTRMPWSAWWAAMLRVRPIDRRLRGRVEQARVAAQQPRDRREVDDRAAAGLDHRRKRVLRHHHHRGHVHPHRPVERLGIDLHRVAGRPGHPDVVDQDVDAAERVERRPDGAACTIRRRRRRSRPGSPRRPPARSSERRLDPLAPLVQQHDAGALAGQQDRRRPPVPDDRATRARVARARAGDDGNLTFEPPCSEDAWIAGESAPCAAGLRSLLRHLRWNRGGGSRRRACTAVRGPI